jgi:hypothetical protein
VSRATKVWITRAPDGTYLANVILPGHPGDKDRGWFYSRESTPLAAAAWIAEMITSHLTKRTAYYDRRAAEREAIDATRWAAASNTSLGGADQAGAT